MYRCLAAGGTEVNAVAVANDVTVIGPANGQAAAAATEVFRQSCATYGLILQGRKCKLVNFSRNMLHYDTSTFADQNNISTETEAAVILGAPIGSNREKVQELALKEIARGDRFFEAIKHPEMPNIIGDRMLRAAGIPRPNFLCRVGMPGEYSKALSQFDKQVERAFAHLIDADPIHFKGNRSCSAPLRHSGMAFTKSSRRKLTL